MAELTIEELREQIANVTRTVGQTKFLPTRIAANAKTLRYVLHWLLEITTDFETKHPRLQAPFYIPNIDSVPFARDENFDDGQLAILNDNVQSADGSLAILYEIQMPGDDDDDLDLEADAGGSAGVPVREGDGKGGDAGGAAASGSKRRRAGKNWVC